MWWWWEWWGGPWPVATNAIPCAAGGASSGSPKVFVVRVAPKQTGEKAPVSLPSSLITHAATGYY